MSGETFNSKIVVDTEIRGDQRLTKYINLLARLGNETKDPGMARGLGRIEKGLVALQGASGGAAKSITAQTAAMRRLRGEANQLQRALNVGTTVKGNAGDGLSLVQRSQKISQDAALQSYQQNIAASKVAGEARVAEGRRVNAALIAQEKSGRQTELAALRSAIQQRATVEQRANTTRAADAQRSNRSILAAEKTARRQELAAFRSSMQERIRLQEQVNKAQMAYASAAAKANVGYGQQIPATENLISQRYALYDVARTWTVVSTAILGTAAAAGKLSINYQRAFADVQRTTGVTGGAVGDLKTALIDLTTTIPTSFADVAGIAALGGQLGIAADGIEDFTGVVAKLTATTDLSNEAAGTALGRFQALLDVPSNEFENLASSILKVGVNSVATETQIVGIATQISSMGDFAGMTGEQVIGLSGALASIGAAPEISRGLITRTFTLMSEAVAEGGDKLQAFAQVSGTSAAEFKAAWGTAEFASTFQRFLQGIEAAGGDAVTVMNDLGITSRRDVPLLLRLAGAGDIVAGSFADAASGYAEGTELGSQYAIIAETIASKLSVLANTIKAVVAALGEGGLGPFGALLDKTQQLADAFLAISRNPVGKAMLGIAASVGVLIGVMAAYRAVQALSLASMFAMRYAQQSLIGVTTGHAGALKGLTGMMVQLGIGTARTTAYNEAFKLSIASGTGTVRAFGAGARAAAVATTGLGVSMKAAIAGTGIGLALIGVTALIMKLTEATADASQQTRDYLGDLSGLAEAMKADTAVWTETGEAIRTFESSITSSSTELSPWVQHMIGATNAQVSLSDATAHTTKEVNDQVNAIGENTRVWLANAIANNEEFQKSWRENGYLIQEAGFNLQDFLNASLESAGGGTAYVDELIAKYQMLYDAQIDAYADAEMAGVGFTDAQLMQYDIIGQTLTALEDLRNDVTLVDGAYAEAANSTDILNGLLGASIPPMDEAGDSAEDLSDALQVLLDAETSLVRNTAAVQDSMYGLGASLAANGNSFSAFSESGRSNLDALQKTLSAMVSASAGDSSVLATLLAGLMQSLSTYGVDAVNELGFVQRMLNQLTGGKGTGGLTGVAAAATNAGNALGQGFSSGATKAAKSASAAKKEVKTLSDYVSDLAGVFANAFDIRFGLGEATDEVAAAYQSLVKDAEDAAQAVIDANEAVSDSERASRDAAQAIRDLAQEIVEADAKIQELSAANNTLEYQLSVAVEYGDTLRATEILAEIAENDAKLSDAQNDRVKSETKLTDAGEELTKAQQAQAKAQADVIAAQAEATRTLIGGTEAAREQREKVLSLVQAYQAQVTALANSGLSTAEVARQTALLREKFIEQLTQLGYNRVEISNYAAAFDDMATIIAKVPRNITIAADANPALRAVDEYISKLQVAQATANNLSNTVISPKFNNADAARQARLLQFQVNLALALATASNESLPYADRMRAGQAAADIRRIIESGSYASGGYTGRGAKYEPAGVVHRGEYVIPASNVNQSTGLPYANALGNLGATTYHSSSNYYNGGYVSGNNNDIQLVELVPTQLQQLARMVSSQVSIDGRVIAETTNRVNTGSARRGSN